MDNTSCIISEDYSNFVNIEDIINEAYEAGDKDIVGCYESGKSNFLDDLK